MKLTRTRALLAVAGGLSGILVLGASACGDGPDRPDVPPTASAKNTATAVPTTAAGTPKAAATRNPGVYSPAPILGDNITKVSPVHATKVAQLQTLSLNPARPGGICAEVTFDGLPENAQWFRMAVNGVEVAQKLSWFVGTNETPKEGTVCYGPKEGLPVGFIQVAIVVQNPNNINEPTRQVVAWEFDVVK